MDEKPLSFYQENPDNQNKKYKHMEQGLENQTEPILRSSRGTTIQLSTTSIQQMTEFFSGDLSSPLNTRGHQLANLFMQPLHFGQPENTKEE